MATGDDPKRRNPKVKAQPKKKLMPKPPGGPPPATLYADKPNQQLVPVKEETMELYDGQVVRMPPPPPPAAWPQAPMPGSCPKSVALLGLHSTASRRGPPVTAPPPLNPPASFVVAPPAPAAPVVVKPPVVVPVPHPIGGATTATATVPVPHPPGVTAATAFNVTATVPVPQLPAATAPTAINATTQPSAAPDNSLAEAEVEKLKNRMSSIRAENQALKAELLEWRKDSAKSREAEQALEQARAARLEAQVREAQDSEDLVRDQLTEMEKKKSGLENLLAEMEKKKSGLENQLAEAKGELKETQRENTELRKHRDLLKKELKDSASLKAEIEAGKSELGILRNQLQKLKEENATLRAKTTGEDSKFNKMNLLLNRHQALLKASFTSQLTALQELRNQTRDVHLGDGEISIENSEAVKQVLADPQCELLVETLCGSSDTKTLEHAMESVRELGKAKGFVVPEAQETAAPDTATEIMEESDKEDKESEKEDEKEAEAGSDESDKAKETGDEKESEDEEKDEKDKKKKRKGKRSKSRSESGSASARSGTRKRRHKRRHRRSVSTNSL